jgi:hypothetical protein
MSQVALPPHTGVSSTGNRSATDTVTIFSTVAAGIAGRARMEGDPMSAESASASRSLLAESEAGDHIDDENPRAESAAPWKAWLDEPLSPGGCALGWLASTAVFVAIVQLFGGPAPGDAIFSTPSTWAIGHGQLGCAFPPGHILIAPVYPFLSGGMTAITHIGHAVPFPARSALGPHCDSADSVISRWSVRAGALTNTLRVGYVGWLALLGGIVSFLRASGRGRCGWEPATLLAVACLPPVWLCLVEYFHPQDLVAMGLALGAMACARRDSWVAAGILVTFAILSQQFAVLVAVPLLVLAPAARRRTFLAAASATAVLAILLLVVLTSPVAVGLALEGTGNTGGTGTVLSTLHLHDATLVICSRGIPIVLSFLLSWWVLRRLGANSALQPSLLVSVVALSLGFRLVFEQALFGYYFMALVVTLVLLDVVAGHIRESFACWLAMVTVVYLVGPTTSQEVLRRTTWGHAVELALTTVVVLMAVVVIVVRIGRGGPRRDHLVWIGLLVGVLLAWPSTKDPFSSHLPTAFWQVVLVSLGLVLAAKPLLDLVRHGNQQPPAGRTNLGSSLAADGSR